MVVSLRQGFIELRFADGVSGWQDALGTGPVDTRRWVAFNWIMLGCMWIWLSITVGWLVLLRFVSCVAMSFSSIISPDQFLWQSSSALYLPNTSTERLLAST
jgi:hypothetical protein